MRAARPRDELLVQRPLHVRARGGRAVLAGVDERARDRAVDGGVQVRVVEDDEGCLAAELQVEPLDGGGGDLGDALADGGGAGEGGHGDVGMADEVLTGFLAGAGDDVDDAVGDPGRGGRLGEEQRGQRGQLGGLEHDRVARGDRREDLPGGHLEGVVPGRDGADDADGFPADVRGVVAGVLARPTGPGGAGRRRRRTRCCRWSPGTSNSRVSLSGLPHWRDSARANSSARSARTAAKRCSASERSPGVAPAQPGKAARAAATAASTSSVTGQLVRVDRRRRWPGRRPRACGRRCRWSGGPRCTARRPRTGPAPGSDGPDCACRSPPPPPRTAGVGVAPARFECRS